MIWPRCPLGLHLLPSYTPFTGSLPLPAPAGFMQQLQLFHAMDCTLDRTHPPYRMFMLAQYARQYEASGTVSAESLSEAAEGGKPAVSGEGWGWGGER